MIFYDRSRRADKLSSVLLLCCSFVIFNCTSAPPSQVLSSQLHKPEDGAIFSRLGNIIPKPVSVQTEYGSFTINSATGITIEPKSDEMMRIGQYLADKLNPATGFNLRVRNDQIVSSNGNITLKVIVSDSLPGNEGYEIQVTDTSVIIMANTPEGIFRGIQTFRQILPSSIERSTVQQSEWKVPSCIIKDYPRFVWRGMMLDVARHFFSVQEVKRCIDLASYYKINRFHLHLSDDQGWRIAIDAFPKLTEIGGSTQTGGGPGGYYSQSDYSDIVSYAAQRYITIIPEIDLPGHTNAALASYPELNCDGIARPLYTGIGVGFSSVCVRKETTYVFIDKVIKEIAAITPGEYIHIGGDEARSTADSDYVYFIGRVQSIVQSHGKKILGWEEIAKSALLPGTIVQHWYSTFAQTAVQQHAKVIMSPSTKAYMDMKYTSSTPIGQDWAALIEVKDGYSWDPAAQVSGVGEKDILGIEAPLWTETIVTMEDIEFMTFPRLPGYAEIGWSQSVDLNWEEYKLRLANHGPRLTAQNINFYKSPQVLWK